MASSDQNNTPRGLIGRRGTPGGKGARLPSIRAPRDLTLGGVPKKTFVPNLNARNRDKGKEDAANVTPSPNVNKNKGRDGRGGRRDRGRGRGRPETIQSHSIFEDGPAQTEMRGSVSAGGVSYGGGTRSSGEASDRRSDVSKAAIKREINLQETNRILDSLLQDNFIVDDDMDDGDKMLEPVKLPLSSAVKNKELKKSGDAEDVKDEVVDGLATGVENIDQPGVSAAEAVHAAQAGIRNIPAAELFQKQIKSETGELLFFQLPDSLPGAPPTTAAENGQKSDNKATTEEEITKAVAKCSLSQFPEGHIGKIQILKSGRMRLVLGNHIVLNLTTGTPCGFLQDVVAVKVDAAKQTGDMAVLGQVTNKVVCSPDFEHLLGLT